VLLEAPIIIYRSNPVRATCENHGNPIHVTGITYYLPQQSHPCYVRK